jgi:hypothetical protein
MGRPITLFTGQWADLRQGLDPAAFDAAFAREPTS